MKLFPVLVLVLGLAAVGFAQPDTLWAHVYGTDNDEFARDVQETDSGDFLIAGQTGMESLSLGICAAKVSATGEQRWFRSYSPPDYGGPLPADGISCMALPGAGGRFTLVATVMYWQHNFGWLLHCTADGDTVSTEAVTGMGQMMFRCGTRLSDRGAILAGTTWNEEGGSVSDSGVILTRLDSEGVVLWSAFIPFETDFYPSKVVPLADGGFAIAGERVHPLNWEDGYGPWSPPMWIDTDVDLIRTDENGEALWSRRIHYEGKNCCNALVCEATDGSLYFATTARDSLDWQVSPEIHLSRFTLGGNLVWDRSYSPGLDPLAYDLLRLHDGSLLMLCGQYMGTSNNYDAGLMRLSSSGQQLGYRTIGTGLGDVLLHLLPVSDGGFVATGWTWDTLGIPHPQWDNFYLVRFGPALMSGGLAAPVPSVLSLANYPNPFNPSTELVFDLPQAGPVTLTVHDLLGREVARLLEGAQTAGHHRVLFDASALSSGVYFGRLQAGTMTRTQKMVLLR